MNHPSHISSLRPLSVFHRVLVTLRARAHLDVLEPCEVAAVVDTLVNLAGAQLATASQALSTLPSTDWYSEVVNEAASYGVVEIEVVECAIRLLRELRKRCDASLVVSLEVARVADFVDEFLIGSLGPRLPSEPRDLAGAVASHLGADYADETR